MKCPLRIALWNVERLGLKAHLWSYSESSVLLSSFLIIIFIFSSWFLILTSHRPSVQFLIPLTPKVPFLKICRYRLSKIAIQLSSQSWPMESKDALFNPSNTFHVCALFDKILCNGKIPASLVFIFDQLGICTLGPFNTFICSCRMILSVGRT